MTGRRLHPVLALLASVALAAGYAVGAQDAPAAPFPPLPATTPLYLHEQTLLFGMRDDGETKQARIEGLAVFRLATAPQPQGAERAIELLALHQQRFAADGGSATLPALRVWWQQHHASEDSLTTPEQLLRAGIRSTFASLAAGSISCCICSSTAGCSDGVFCNGEEVCDSNNMCASGAPPCYDGDACTDDICFEATDTCAYDPVPPPDEVASVWVDRDAVQPSLTTLSWTAVAEAVGYNVYRGSSADLSDLGCFAAGLPVTTQPDFDVPPGLFLYLVSSVACGESGLGAATAAPRPNPPPCP